MNGLELVKSALKRWRDGEGGTATTYNWCQKFDGWYVSRVQTDKSKLQTYTSAKIAYENSKCFTVKDINDPRIRPGDSLYFRYGEDGHIVTAVGWDYADGKKRLLTSQTANKGDTVIKLTNNVKIMHADTFPFPFLGVSHRNGTNPERKGITPYEINKPEPIESNDMTAKAIYHAVKRTSPQKVKGGDKSQYLRLNDDGAVSVLVGPADVASGELSLLLVRDAKGANEASFQVTPYVETLDDAGKVSKSSSLRLVEFVMTSGKTGIQVAVPNVKLTANQRVRFKVATTDGLNVTIESGSFRGAVFINK